MHAERTPNPNAIKWVLDAPLAGGAGAWFEQAPGADVSPLAARLFAVSGVAAVHLGPDFVTVTKAPQVEWPQIAEALAGVLRGHAASGEPALGPGYRPREVRADADEVSARIRRILEQEIRPAVALDGGDVVFVGYREGRVELRLRGACEGCPGSSATLRQGIEVRLREAVPEVREVVAR